MSAYQRFERATRELCHPGCRCRGCVEKLSERGWARHRHNQSIAAGRIGGIRSGIVRRRLARRRRGIPRGVDRELRLTYEPRRLSRKEFNHLYETKHMPRPSHHAAEARWEEGREGCWQHLQSWYALHCVRGQYCRATNKNRAKGLANRGHARHERTVQRYNVILEKMGVAKVTGYSKFVPGKGWTGYTVLEWRVTRRVRNLACRTPSGNGKPTTASQWVSRRSTSKPLAPPTSSANAEPPDKPAELPVTDDEEREARIRFLQARLEHPFGTRTAQFRAELAVLVAQASPTSAPSPASSPDSDRGSSAPSSPSSCDPASAESPASTRPDRADTRHTNA